MSLLANRWVRWFVTWLSVTVLIVAVGAALGALVFPLFGKLGGSDKSLADLALLGVRNLAFYAFIWAPGTAIVVTVMRERARR